jgi:cysteine desulfurase
MFNWLRKTVYADTAAATPVSRRAVKVMQPFEQAVFYNPSSLYPAARIAKEAVEKSRRDIALLMSVQPQTIVFTSGGTESAHLAILGTISKAKESGIKIPHIVCTSFEHPAVLELLRLLHIKTEIALTEITPLNDGIVKVQNIIDAIHTDTVLVCCMFVNNELGTIQPVRKISSEIKKIKNNKTGQNKNFPYVYTDAAQAPQALGINRDQLGADLVSFDSAKIYGPKGIGCLYIEQHSPINPIQYGGGQEHGMRSGTEPVALIVGFAEAMKETIEVQKDQINLHKENQKYFLKKLELSGIEFEINGSINEDERIPQNLNLCFKKNGKPINSEFLTIQLGEKGIMVSPGASCTSNKTSSASQSVEAIGKSDCASSSIRFTFGRNVSKSDINSIVKALKEVL